MNIKDTKPSELILGLQTVHPASCCSNTATEYLISLRSANVTLMYKSDFHDKLYKSGVWKYVETRDENRQNTH